MTTSPEAPTTGIVLLGHGSPDPDWRRPLDALVERLRARAEAVRVELAFLDHGADLDAAVGSLHAAGCRRIKVIAALLSPGGKHVKVDMPRLVREVGARYPESTLLWEPDALGADPRVLAAMADAVLERAGAIDDAGLEEAHAPPRSGSDPIQVRPSRS